MKRREPFIEKSGPVVDPPTDAFLSRAARWIDGVLNDKRLGPFVGEISLEAKFDNGATLKIGSRPFDPKRKK